MGFFSVSFYRSYYYFIIVWILDISNSLIKGTFESMYSEKKHMNIIIELIYLLCLTIGDLLAGFLVLYTYKNSQSEKQIDYDQLKRNSSHIEFIYNDLSIKKNKNYLILLISILEFIGRSTDFFYYFILGHERIRDGEITWLISLDILSRIVFSHFILKQNLYRHHFLSIFLTVIGLTSMSICAFIIIKSNELMNWPYFIFIGIKFIIFALEDAINKLLLISKFLLPQTLMFWRGLYIFSLLLFLVPILFFTNSSKFQFDFDIKGYKLILHISLLIVIIPIVFLKSFFVMKVIYAFTPQHIAFINVVFYMLLLLRCRIISSDKIIFITADVIILIVIIFSTLIFNEMLIINSCGLGDNTRKGFLIKEEKDYEDSKASLIKNEDMNKSKDSCED